MTRWDRTHLARDISTAPRSKAAHLDPEVDGRMQHLEEGVRRQRSCRWRRMQVKHRRKSELQNEEEISTDSDETGKGRGRGPTFVDSC
jgi:hypothetical protein